MGLFGFGKSTQQSEPQQPQNQSQPTLSGPRFQLAVPDPETLDTGQVGGTMTVTAGEPTNIQGIHLRLVQKHVPINPLNPGPPVDGPLEQTYAETTTSDSFTLQPGETRQLPFQFTFNPPFATPSRPTGPAASGGTAGFLGKALHLAEAASGKDDPNHQWDFYLWASPVVNGLESEHHEAVQLWGKPYVGESV